MTVMDETETDKMKTGRERGTNGGGNGESGVRKGAIGSDSGRKEGSGVE